MTAPTLRRWVRRHIRARQPDVVVTGAEPLAQITVYPDVTLLTRRHGRTWRQYPIDPGALAETLAHVPITSGLLPPHTLASGRLHGAPFFVVFVPPRQATLRTEKERFSLPLPPLVWAGWRDDYRLFALASKDAPTLRTPLFLGPFPNLYADGRICWGSSDPRPQAAPDTLQPVLDLFLTGSYFNLHLANGKSQAFPNSVIAQWQALKKTKTASYPTDDLIAVNRTLDDLVSGRIFGGAS
jgi:PRTRC genetic system protein B